METTMKGKNIERKPFETMSKEDLKKARINSYPYVNL